MDIEQPLLTVLFMSLSLSLDMLSSYSRPFLRSNMLGCNNSVMHVLPNIESFWAIVNLCESKGDDMLVLFTS